MMNDVTIKRQLMQCIIYPEQNTGCPRKKLSVCYVCKIMPSEVFVDSFQSNKVNRFCLLQIKIQQRTSCYALLQSMKVIAWSQSKAKMKHKQM